MATEILFENFIRYVPGKALNGWPLKYDFQGQNLRINCYRRFFVLEIPLINSYNKMENKGYPGRSTSGIYGDNEKTSAYAV